METCDTEVGHEAVSNFLIFPSYRIHPVSWQQLLAWAVVQCTGIASLQMASVAEQLQGLQNSRVLKKNYKINIVHVNSHILSTSL